MTSSGATPAGLARDEAVDPRRSECWQSAQRAVADILALSETADAALRPVLRNLCEAFEAQGAAFWRPGPDGRLVCAEFWSHPPAPAFEAEVRARILGLDEGVPGSILSSGRPVWAEEVPSDPSIPRPADGLLGGFGVPVLLGEAGRGVLEFFVRTTRPADRGALEALSSIGGHLGQFMERKHREAELREMNAALERRVRERTEQLERRERLLVQAEELAGLGSWEWDVAEGALTWTEELFRIYGVDPAAFRPSFQAFLERVHPDDRARVEAAVRDALRTGAGLDHEERIVRPDGEVRTLRSRSRVVVDAQGRPVRMLGTCLDVTDQKRRENQARLFAEAQAGEEVARFMARASETLFSSLDDEVMLRNLARLAVPRLGDYASIHLLEADGTIRNVALAHQDPRKVALVEEIVRRYPTPPDQPIGAPQVIRTGQSEQLDRLDPAVLRAVAQDEEHLRLIEGLGLRSALTVPLRGPDRILGALTLCWAESDRLYTAADRTLAEDLGRRAGLAVENARLYARAREEALERGRAQVREARRARQALLGAQVGKALTTAATVREMLQRSAQALVDTQDAAFARIWTLDEAAKVLVLEASAGLYTHIDGPHGRVPVGAYKIGRIAEEGLPHLTNDVAHDPRVSNREWARREGMVSFAGYPLKIDDRVVGVMALFARLPLTEDTLEALGSIADSIAVGLERKRKETQLRELNARLEERVQERTAELQAANRELEAFSYSVSHDLRGPLRSMDGYSQVLLRRYADRLDERGRGYLEKVCAATDRMGKLIDDFLSLSKLTRTPLVLEIVDLSALAAEIAGELRRANPGRNVELRIAPGMKAKGDPRLLRVVVENLMGNAWKFTREKDPARVEVEACVREGATAYVVRDDGAGFDMAFAGKLFKPFERLHAIEDYPGTGIGLASVQRVVARHGGRVWAEGAVGRGAAFYFTLGG